MASTDIPAHAGSGANVTHPVGPPKKGYAVQYERLLVEELSLKKSREEFLKSKRGGGESQTNADDDEPQKLKIRGMMHRASLEGMLIAAQNAADDFKANTNVDYERGLDRAEAKNALASLWTMKSRQLEEDDNRIPLYIGSESLASRRRFSSGIGGWNGVSGSKQPALLEADVDDFFNAFPGCRQRNDATFDEDELEGDDNEDLDNQKPASKKKRETKKAGSNDEPIIVTCASSSPSPERSNAATTMKMKNQRNQPHNNPKQQLPTNNLASSNNRGNQHPNYPPHSHRQQNYSLSGNCANNAYQQKQRGTHQNQWQNVHQHHPFKNETISFDYKDNNSHYKDDRSKPALKNNPFCTAKELGPNFNDESQGGKGGGRSGGDNDWGNNGSNGGNSHNQRRIVGAINNKPTSSAPGGAQRMVHAAIRGPKDMSSGLRKQFQQPMKRNGGVGGGQSSSNGNSKLANRQAGGGASSGGGGKNDDEELPEELRGCDKELVEKINNDIVDSGERVTFKDIAGLEDAKKVVNEMVLLPMKRPDLFTGLRSCPKGLLLFGPPGTGKTLIGKAIAHESGATFFSISSSSLTSKWIGEGEKLVRTLFAVARYRAPSIVFIDEVDSLLTQRKADENEASRRIKTEFLVQLDGAGNKAEGQVLIVGATNLPHELDDAARRRFVKKLYIPLPEQPGRESLIRTLLAKNKHSLDDGQIAKISHDSHGFSGADLHSLCSDAAMGPMRELSPEEVETMHKDAMPPISYRHFRTSLRNMNPSVAQSDLAVYLQWNDTYGNKASNDDGKYGSDTCSEDESS